MPKFTINNIDRGFLALFVVAALMTFAPHVPGWLNAIGIGFLLTTVGAFIAYWGDIIGHTIGKKRLSTFNLRPRQTAILWTIAAGGAGALVTYIILLSLNAGFRVAVLRGNQLVRHNRSLERSITKLNDKVLGLTAAESQANAHAFAAQALEQQSVTELHSTQANLKVASDSLLSAQSDLRQRQSDLDRLAAELNSEKKNLHLTRAERDQLRQDITKAAADLTVAKNKIVLANAYLPVLSDARSKRLIYDNQQEVGRIVIDHASQNTIFGELSVFLDHLSDQAEKLGASTNSATGRTVKLAPVEILNKNLAGSHSAAWADEKDLLMALADQIHSSGKPSVVVIAQCVGNAFENATVDVQLRPYANVLAVPKGTVVASTTVDGASASPEQVMGAIQSLLVKQVRPFAISQGVIPVQENAREQAQLGDVPLTEIVRAVQEVQQIKGDAVISAYVPADVYSADQLHLELSVKPTLGGGRELQPLGREPDPGTKCQAAKQNVAILSRTRIISYSE